MKGMIDLHTHSYLSDGTCSPKEIIKLAYKNNIKAIALTDHDNIEGNIEAENEAIKLNIDFLRGIEISARYEGGRIIHILGLGIDIKNKKFLEVYDSIKKAREESVINIISILRSQGIYIDYDTLRERSVNKYLDRYDIHRYFIDRGICTKAQEVWDKYLDPIPYGIEELIDVRKAIEIIKEAGGLSFLAHYNKKIGLYGYTKSELEEHILQLKNIGLDGIEQYYPSYSEEDKDYVNYLIEKYKFISSGGTDFHGNNRPDIFLGTGSNNLNIPYSIFENIQTILKGNNR